MRASSAHRLIRHVCCSGHCAEADIVSGKTGHFMAQDITWKLPTPMTDQRVGTHGDEFSARCPSCNAWSTFRAVGEQHWPLEVARLTGLPSTIRLYVCYNCGSTISEQNLN